MGEPMIMGRITDESVEKMRMLVGYANPTVRTGWVTKPHNTVASPDAFRHYAEGYGDDNPLYTDAAYGVTTRWGAPIAPPGYEWTTGANRTRPTPPDLAAGTRGVLRGVQLYNSGVKANYYKPIVPGDEFEKTTVVVDVQEKASEFAGRSVIVTNESTWTDRQRRPAVVSQTWFVHAERKKVTGDGKYAREDAACYSDEELAEIEKLYDDEYRRGADTLYFEDVEVGTELPVTVKGPFTVTDLINLHIGAGWYSYGNPPFKLAHYNRKLMRGFYTRNEFNAWDVVQRIHWDPAHAREIGVARAYDIGPLRYTYVVNHLTNWMGDDAWLFALRTEYRRFNYVGDTTFMRGQVSGKRLDETLGPLVEVAVRGENQRGDTSVSAEATILLPSRRSGPVVMPPSPDVADRTR